MTRSFGAPLDCVTAKTFEDRVICRSGRLRALDRKLARIESELAEAIPDVAASHAEWLGELGACGDSASCFAGSYESRIAALEKMGREAVARSGTALTAGAAAPAGARLDEVRSSSPDNQGVWADRGPEPSVALEAELWRSTPVDLAARDESNDLSTGMARSPQQPAVPAGEECEFGTCETAVLQEPPGGAPATVAGSTPSTPSELSGGTVAAMGGGLVAVMIAAIVLGNRFSFFKWLFWWPGYLILFLQYFWPTEWGKGRDVAGGARRWKAREWVAPFYSVVIYGFLLFMFLPYLIALARA